MSFEELLKNIHWRITLYDETCLTSRYVTFFPQPLLYLAFNAQLFLEYFQVIQDNHLVLDKLYICTEVWSYKVQMLKWPFDGFWV